MNCVLTADAGPSSGGGGGLLRLGVWKRVVYHSAGAAGANPLARETPAAGEKPDAQSRAAPGCVRPALAGIGGPAQQMSGPNARGKRIARTDDERAFGGDVGRAADVRNDARWVALDRPLEHAADDALLPPLLRPRRACRPPRDRPASRWCRCRTASGRRPCPGHSTKLRLSAPSREPARTVRCDRSRRRLRR